jgi:hypothetical protein
MKSSAIAKMLVGVSLVQILAGCAPSKATQCNTLANTVNQGVALGKKLQGFGDGLGNKFRSAKNINEFQSVAKETVGAIDSMVGEIDQFSKSVAAVELKDTSLIGFRDRAVANYNLSATTLKSMSANFKEISTAKLEPGNAEQLKSRLNALQESAAKMTEVDNEEKKISSEFNTYCGVTPKQ